MPIDVNNGYHLEQGNDHKSDGASKRVKHLQPVLPSAGREDKTHQKTESADHTWADMHINLAAALLV